MTKAGALRNEHGTFAKQALVLVDSTHYALHNENDHPPQVVILRVAWLGSLRLARGHVAVLADGIVLVFFVVILYLFALFIVILLALLFFFVILFVFVFVLFLFLVLFVFLVVFAHGFDEVVGEGCDLIGAVG